MTTIAMVHYHLRRGGVTRVIEHIITALQSEQVKIVLVTGEPPTHPESWSVPVCVVEGLGYAKPDETMDAEALGLHVQQAVRAVNGGQDPDVWHMHNHALGKNPAWTEAVAQLAADGHRLLLHIHDFAEDGRPANYHHLTSHVKTPLGRTLYPQFARTHYAVLNRRDYDYLLSAGWESARLHLLPNAIEPHDSGVSDETGLILYPTRAIRRKNIGEFLLWSAVCPDLRFGITLAPESPAEIKPYEQWKAFAAEWELPVEFEMGFRHDFRKLMDAAQTLFTTSIAEGFGLAFLEPWLAGKPLVGRDLPEVTQEFRQAGMQLDGLYAELTVPGDWIDRDVLQADLRRELTRLRKAYGRETGPEDMARAWADAWQHDRVEFGHLNEAAQEQVIQRVCESASARSELPTWEAPCEAVASNRKIVLDIYGLSPYRERLMNLYHGLLTAPAEARPDIDADAILDQYIAPERFRLLRT